MANTPEARGARRGRHLDGKKFACLKCIRGNRSEQCKPGKHMEDLRWIRQRGRPQGARNHLGSKPGRKFSPEKFTALSAYEFGRVPAEESLLPVEGNQTQVANGQAACYTPQLLGEMDLALSKVEPSMLGDEAGRFDAPYTEQLPEEYIQLTSQSGYEAGFNSLPYNGQMPAEVPPQQVVYPRPQAVVNSLPHTGQWPPNHEAIITRELTIELLRQVLDQ